MVFFMFSGVGLGQTPSKYQIAHASGPCKLVLLNKELVSPKAFQSPSGKIHLKGPLASFSISPEGGVSDVKVVTSSGSKDLDKVVLTSLSKWKYKARPTGCGTIDSQIIITPDLFSTEN